MDKITKFVVVAFLVGTMVGFGFLCVQLFRVIGESIPAITQVLGQ